MQNDGIQKRHEIRKLIIYAVVAIIILLILIMIPIIRSSRSDVSIGDENKLDNNEAEIVEEEVAISYIVFQNADFIRQTFGTVMGNDILDSVQDAILTNYNKPAELAASIDEKSLIEKIYFPYTTYSMIMNLSDGKSPYVGLATDKNMYVGVLVQYDAANAPVRLSIIFSNNVGSSKYDRDSVISGLTKWAKNTAGVSEITVSTKN